MISSTPRSYSQRLRFAANVFLLVGFSNAAFADLTEQRIVASDTAREDYFSADLDVSGDTAVVGSFNDKAYFFKRMSDGIWAEESIVRSLSGFGSNVVIDGDTAVISTADYSGRVQSILYRRHSSGVWIQEVVFQSTDGFNFSPSSNSINGDTLVFEVTDAGASRAAHVFRRNSNGGWDREDIITIDDLMSDEYVRYHAAISGDTIMFTSTRVNVLPYTGRVHVFERDTNGNWNRQAILTQADARSDLQYGGDIFGSALAISGDIAVIGSVDNTGTGSNCKFPAVCELEPEAGSAFVYERDANGGWIEKVELRPSQPTEVKYGHEVAIDGETILVESFDFVYIYKLTSNGQWTEHDTIDKSVTGFTSNVAISGDTIWLGSPGSTDAGYDSGAAYVFTLNNSNCIDSDGDGWGWDGFTSCLVEAEPIVTPATDCIDSDGDGWGWDGATSCLVEAELFVIPATDCIDLDGDGWGWDGQGSCIVEESVCLDTDGDGWGWDGLNSCIIE